RRPAGVDDGAHPALCEERLDRLGGHVLLVRDASLLEIFEQERDRLRRVLLVRADDSRRAALDPAGAVRLRLADDTTAFVQDRAAVLVEGDVWQPNPPVANTAK